MLVKEGITADDADDYEVRIGGVDGGYLTYSIAVEAATPNVVYGDVNGDNVPDGSDALAVQKYSVRMVEFTEAQKDAGDVTDDGLTDGADALDIQKYSVRIISEFIRK